MSRGLGSLQRHVLDRLAQGGDDLIFLPRWERGYVSSYTLAYSYAGGEQNASLRASMQRAIRGLEELGQVEVEAEGRLCGFCDLRRGVRRAGLAVRLLPSEAQREREDVEAGEAVKNLAEIMRGRR
jgi:hypothetical protein